MAQGINSVSVSEYTVSGRTFLLKDAVIVVAAVAGNHSSCESSSNHRAAVVYTQSTSTSLSAAH
jgi:hypothetical protein